MHSLLPSVRPDTGNFADLVLRHCHRQPWVSALIWQDGEGRDHALSFGELGQAVSRMRQYVRSQGWTAGDRIVVMHPPAPALYAAVLGLLADGLIPVFIDTGMGRRKALQALDDSHARAVLAPAGMQAVGRLLDRFARPWHALPDMTSVQAPTHTGPCAPCSTNTHGLISYTSGTTGRPKGADRTHASLIAQHQAIRADWPDDTTDIDMTCLPVLVLHNLCCGMPSVLPAMDFRAPAQAPGETILGQIERHGVTRLSGAGAFLGRVAEAALEHGGCQTLRSIRVGGAPVNAKLADLLIRAFPRADIAVVYGSTEAEPIAHGPAQDILTDPGPGYPVGHPSPLAQIAILPPEAHPQSEAEVLAAALPRGASGEIWVCGHHVLKGYVDNPEATAESKVPCQDGRVWHRTGDLGWQHADGQLYLLGRSKECLVVDGQSLPTGPVERLLDEHPAIRRSALIQYQANTLPHLFIEPEPGSSGTTASHVARHLLVDAGLQGCPIHVVISLPTDSRHNSKIQRQPLRRRCQPWRRYVSFG